MMDHYEDTSAIVDAVFENSVDQDKLEFVFVVSPIYAAILKDYENPEDAAAVAIERATVLMKAIYPPTAG